MAATDPQKDLTTEQRKRDSFARDFATDTDKFKKIVAASYLVSVGDPNPIYFEYLDNLARVALERAGPYPFVLEPWKPGLPPIASPQGRELSPEYRCDGFLFIQRTPTFRLGEDMPNSSLISYPIRLFVTSAYDPC